MIHRAAQSQADCLILDLEDAVPENWKIAARESIRHALDQGIDFRGKIFVRVNSLRTNLTWDDLQAVACQYLSGFVYPQAESVEEIRLLDDRLHRSEAELNLSLGHFSLLPLIESPRGLMNCREIGQSSHRVKGLIFGCEDYLAALQGRHDDLDTALMFPRSMVAATARALGLEPIDAPYVKVHDLEGLRLFAETGRNLGMSGMLVLSPRQLEIVNRAYTPTEAEIQQACLIVAAAPQEENLGISIVEGHFVSPPTVRAARKLLERAEAIRLCEESRR
jgi:citrate lyase subunit beta/citryl-CoA lyase